MSGESEESTHQPNVVESEQHSIIVRALWFIFIGWWATGFWLAIAWLLNLSIIGIPLGLKMINKVPYVVSLKKRSDFQIVSESEDGVEVTKHTPEQYALWKRALYFVCVGWWLSAIWMGIAYLLTLPVITLPLAVWMYDRLPFVVSLYRLE